MLLAAATSSQVLNAPALQLPCPASCTCCEGPTGLKSGASVTPDRNSCSNSITAVKENSVGLGLWRRGMPPVAVYAALQQSGAMPDKEQPRLPTKLPVAVVGSSDPDICTISGLGPGCRGGGGKALPPAWQENRN